MTKNKNTSLHANPFYVLGVTTRDDRRKIVEMAEERSLHIDDELCQKARSDLTNTRTRLAVEMSWMPGAAPRVAEKLVKMLQDDPLSVRSDNGLSALACANLMASAFELVEDDEETESISEFIRDFAWVVEMIDAEKVFRDINEDRAISGFPEVRSVELIEEELVERRKTYRSVLKNLLDTLDPKKLIETMTQTVSVATDNGESHGLALIDELADAYEVEVQGFLQKESENIEKLIESVRAAAPQGTGAVNPLLDKLEKVARNWDKVAQPIQLSAKSRGIQHRPSSEIAYELRSLGVDLNNEHDMLDQAHRMTELLRELFAELPDMVERLGEDAEAIAGLRSKAKKREENEVQWARDVTFRDEIGLFFKDELSISPEGIRWKNASYPLNSITMVRWGAINKSVNGVPSGTDYVIGIGDGRSSVVIQPKKESTYSGFTDALWRGVCVRLIFEMISALAEGKSLVFGDITVSDEYVTLTLHKFLGANEQVRLSWKDVHVWSAGGSFVIGKKDNKKIYGSSSYINAWNTHIIEHVVRGSFKKGGKKLSDFAK